MSPNRSAPNENRTVSRAPLSIRTGGERQGGSRRSPVTAHLLRFPRDGRTSVGQPVVAHRPSTTTSSARRPLPTDRLGLWQNWLRFDERGRLDGLWPNSACRSSGQVWVVGCLSPVTSP